MISSKGKWNQTRDTYSLSWLEKIKSLWAWAGVGGHVGIPWDWPRLSGWLLCIKNQLKVLKNKSLPSFAGVCLSVVLFRSQHARGTGLWNLMWKRLGCHLLQKRRKENKPLRNAVCLQSNAAALCRDLETILLSTSFDSVHNEHLEIQGTEQK